jgi:cyclopropane-fatty-acyl-phospholipid synthase
LSVSEQTEPSAATPVGANCVGGVAKPPSLHAWNERDEPVTDIEVLRLHYAETLKAWRQRFLAHREEVERIYDQRFVRMWEFYLAASEMAFREQALMEFQIQLTRRQGVVPTTRDYIARETARLRGLETGQRQPLRLAGE